MYSQPGSCARPPYVRDVLSLHPLQLITTTSLANLYKQKIHVRSFTTPGTVGTLSLVCKTRLHTLHYVLTCLCLFGICLRKWKYRIFFWQGNPSERTMLPTDARLWKSSSPSRGSSTDPGTGENFCYGIMAETSCNHLRCSHICTCLAPVELFFNASHELHNLFCHPKHLGELLSQSGIGCLFSYPYNWLSVCTASQ